MAQQRAGPEVTQVMVAIWERIGKHWENLCPMDNLRGY
jgi:hypothetical protein